MIRVGTLIKTPKNLNYIKTFINGNQKRSSFFHNVTEKSKDKKEYIVKERYVVTTSFQVKANCVYTIDRIIGVETKEMTDNKGKKYFNTCVYVELSIPRKKEIGETKEYLKNNNEYNQEDSDYEDYI